ncbi:MAG: class I SAM-dependent methyltransferase [Bacteroidota bacterium]|nr:class I SAM-dependent methyltransferase [Bacteroidota bacterium]MDP4215987.1 class I SAM-dependent methyltransferase [Bacteroidota bacterium]MDP4245090.1 class I SAM-dependent methyltransferase [Bacteroidota bacterium]MDP4252540.1 class I SAM-dependent methyltransferase [Bacteroidota bacterium]MDP4257824.1 class I SAM-dependent methyltransferase [Bacteroidota bacterium]
MRNIFFYDQIAQDYDAIMEEERSNGLVRQKVIRKFLETVAPGRVLDFGGGTGSDLGWLTDHYYHVIFCEPSVKMKDLAIRRHQRKSLPGHVEFLSGPAVDFTGWNRDLPFYPPADAILANFAVINCIEDIDTLFRSLSLVVRPGGSLIALLLRPNWRHTLRSMAGLAPGTLEVRYKGYEQTVYVHTPVAVRRASGDYFDFSGWRSLHGSVFSILHLTRK